MYFSGTDIYATRILLINERSLSINVVSPFSSLTAVVWGGGYAAAAAYLSAIASL
jgi:hypothetical protein